MPASTPTPLPTKGLRWEVFFSAFHDSVLNDWLFANTLDVRDSERTCIDSAYLLREWQGKGQGQVWDGFRGKGFITGSAACAYRDAEIRALWKMGMKAVDIQHEEANYFFRTQLVDRLDAVIQGVREGSSIQVLWNLTKELSQAIPAAVDEAARVHPSGIRGNYDRTSEIEYRLLLLTGLTYDRFVSVRVLSDTWESMRRSIQNILQGAYFLSGALHPLKEAIAE